MLSLSLPGEPEGATAEERELFVRGLVNTHLRAMTKALGALIRWVRLIVVVVIDCGSEDLEVTLGEKEGDRWGDGGG